MEASKQRILEVLAAGVQPWLERFDPQTGRFRTEPDGPPAPGAKPEDLGWGVINQDIIYVLATLYSRPGTALCDDPAIRDLALRGGDAIRDFQYPDGQVEFLKADGSRWGPTYMCWTNYAWLETYALLRDDLDEDRRRRWEEGLTLAHDGQAREISSRHVHNIPCWKAMSCYRAGQLFGRPDWQEAAWGLIEQALSELQPGGYWAEHGGPSTVYNHVYVHALALYHVFSGDERLLPALAAATDFHATFLYPDGAPIETVDGRVKYHGNIFPMGWVGYSTTPRGRRLVAYLAERLDPQRDCKSFQGGSLASAVHHLHAGDQTALDVDQPKFCRRYQNWALVSREAPWFACLSAYVCPPVASRWGQDRQAFLSLWHEERGLVLGGGNSKDQAEWSTFVADGRFLPDRGELLAEADGIALQYGRVRAGLRVTWENGKAVITATAEGGPALQQFVLQVRPGDHLRSAAGLEVTLGEDAVHWRPQQVGEWLEFGGLCLTVPAGTEFRWPTLAFNPYAADGAAAFGSERGLLAVRVDGAPVRWELGVS